MTTSTPAQPKYTAPFAVSFVGNSGSYRSAGLAVCAPQGPVVEPSNTLQSDVFPGKASLWVLGDDQRIYPFVDGAPSFDCCWDLAGRLETGVAVFLAKPLAGATSQQWSFNWWNYTITNVAAPGDYYLDDWNQPTPGGRIAMAAGSSPNGNQLWTLQLAPQSIPERAASPLTFSPPVQLMFAGEGGFSSWGMKLSGGITQCAVVLGKNAQGSSSTPQRWVFGSDGRIYPYQNTTYCLDLDPYGASSPQNGTALVLNFVRESDTQLWTWSPDTGAISNQGAPGYLVDLNKGTCSEGSKIQIWSATSPNSHQIWMPEVLLDWYPAARDRG